MKQSQQQKDKLEVLERYDIFLHYLTSEVQEYLRLKQAYFTSGTDSEIEKEFLFATKVALLFCKDRIIIPPSALTECAYVRKTLEEALPFRDLGLVWFADSVSSPLEFREKKIRQFAVNPNLVPFYAPAIGVWEFEREFKFSHFGKWKQRVTGATPVIKRLWTDSVEKSHGLLRQLYQYRGSRITPGKFDKSMHNIPERLGSTAFITDFVIPYLPTGSVPGHIVREIRALIARFYIQSYLDEFNAICLKDFGTVDVNKFIPMDRNHLSLQRVRDSLLVLGISELFERILTCEDLVYLRLLDRRGEFLRLALNPIRLTKEMARFRRNYTEECIHRITRSTNGMERAVILFDLVKLCVHKGLANEDS